MKYFLNKIIFLIILLFAIVFTSVAQNESETKKIVPIDSTQLIPNDLLFADVNGDGKISQAEMDRVIANFFEYKTGFNLRVISKLISFYHKTNPDQKPSTQMQGLLDKAIQDSIKKTGGPNLSQVVLKHKADKYTSVGAQITSAYQYQSPLSNPKYTGPTSISANHDEQTLTMTTVNGLFNPWKTGEILVSPEIQIGNGIGNGAGMGAYPNALFGFPQSTPYLLRAQYRQHFFFKDSGKIKEYNFTIGRYVLQEMFDGNPYSGDPKKDFMNFNHTMLGAWDAATTAYGYTHGFGSSLIFEKSSVNLSINTHNLEAGGDKTDWNVRQAYSFNLQYVHDFSLFGKTGKVRLLGFYNSYNGGDFNHYCKDTITGETNYDSTHTYTNKYGGGIDINYDLNENSGLFLRYSLDDGLHEDFGYTQCDASLNAGALLGMKIINRPFDKLGFCGSYNMLSAKQQRFLNDAGSGFMLGDGNLKYAPEMAFETFYALNFFYDFYLTIDYQYVLNVGYNADRANAHFIAVRLNLEL